MELRIPATVLAPPEQRHFEARDGRPESHPWHVQIMCGSDIYKLYANEDPTAGLNGSRTKIAQGQMTPVVAVLRLYANKTSKPGVSLECFEEVRAEPAGK